MCPVSLAKRTRADPCCCFPASLLPLQRVLLIAHSNQALNDLFEKILDRDIAEHHMLRLGA